MTLDVDLDPLKLILFAVVFAALLIIARILFSRDDTDSPGLETPPVSEIGEAGQPVPTQRLTGADIPFPVPLPPVTRLESGAYNRPIIKNYYFKTIDLVRGPEDPHSFCDDFFLGIEDPETGYVGKMTYTVATPAGLQAALEREHYSALFLDSALIVVPKWDLAGLLKAIVDDLLEKHAIPESAWQSDASRTSEDDHL